MASYPWAARWASVSAQASGLRLATTTPAPAAPNPSAIARPIPRVPPVTMATRPVRSNSRLSFSRSIGAELYRPAAAAITSLPRHDRRLP